MHIYVYPALSIVGLLSKLGVNSLLIMFRFDREKYREGKVKALEFAEN